MLMSSLKKTNPEAYRGVTNGTLTDQKGPGDWESQRDVENVERDTGRFKGLFSLLFRIVCVGFRTASAVGFRCPV